MTYTGPKNEGVRLGRRTRKRPRDPGGCRHRRRVGRGGKDEKEDYEEAWQIVNEKTLQGWKLQSMEKAPADDDVKLTWETSGDRRRQE